MATGPLRLNALAPTHLFPRLESGRRLEVKPTRTQPADRQQQRKVPRKRDRLFDYESRSRPLQLPDFVGRSFAREMWRSWRDRMTKRSARCLLSAAPMNDSENIWHETTLSVTRPACPRSSSFLR